MPLTRRQALETLSALLAVPLLRWPDRVDDPLAGTILEFQAGRVRGDWTAEEVTRRALDRSYAWNRVLHSTDLLSDTALAEARASDARVRKGDLLGMLDGVPIFAKSIYDMRGLPTTASSAAWAALFPDAVARDSIEVARLRAAGAIVLGKTVADDFAYHGNGTSSLSGQVRNPHDPTATLTPGGSSAGSAVSVACGIAFAALGTDDGGSNRIPAQFSGVVGMKPTFGLVPRTGVIPTWPYLDTHGPLARFVADAALLLEAIAGWSDSDGLSLPGDRASLANFADAPLRGARLGLVDAHIPRDKMSAESLAVWDRALDDLKGAGVEIVPFAPDTTLWNVRQQFADLATKRGDVKPDSRSPAATANALLRYFQRHHGDARTMVRRGLAAYQHFYDVLPLDWDAMARIMVEPYEQDPAGQSFARSRAALNARLAAQFRRGADRRDDLPDHPLPRPACRRRLARHPHHAGLRQLARHSRGVSTERLRRDRAGGRQHLVRGNSGQRCAGACRGARLRAGVAAVRGGAGGELILRTDQRRTVTMAQYIRRRTGVQAGGRGGLRNMFSRSLGARSPGAFWRYWNPVFGYTLGRYVNAPLRRLMPAALALELTFLVCGAFHDLVTMAARGSWAFLFTPWFFFLGIGVLLGQWTRLDLSQRPWLVRTCVNLVYLAGCLGLALVVKRGVGL